MHSHRILPALLLLSIAPAFAGISSIAALPGPLTVSAMKTDAAGNLYIAGSGPNPKTANPGGTAAIVAKLSGDGTTVQFLTTLAGHGFDSATAMAIAADGTILVAGSTSSPDFPVTAGAAETTNPAAGIGGTGFFARLDAKGNVLYASYVNGATPAGSPTVLSILDIATDASGAAYITGQGILASTAGALPAVQYFGSGFFVAKLDASGKLAFSTGAGGGTHIAVDAQGNIYVAGSERSGYPVPITPGAFQSTVKDTVCSSTFGPDGGIAFSCMHQYVVKLNPTASTLLYGTWVSGTNGANVTGLAVDAQGNAVVAGATQSADYPVTAGAFQTVDYANNPPPSNAMLTIAFLGFNPGPPATGYVSKLNTAGTGLIFSTYLGGSGIDSVSNMTLESTGDVLLAGTAQSPDFPGLMPMPDPCRPSFLHGAPFLTRLSADGGTLSETQMAPGLSPATGYPSPQPLAVFPSLGKAALLDGNALAMLTLSSDPAGLACVTDAADMAPLAQVAPGQLVSLFGYGIGAINPAVAQTQNGQVPSNTGGTSVTFNGTAAPILYTSPGQINVQAPYEIAGQSNAQMKVSGGTLPAGADFLVTASQPSAFVVPGYASCQKVTTNNVLPLAFHADGSQVTCGNPATPGSTITILLNGLGLAGGQPSTGAIAAPPATPLNQPVTVSGGVTLVAAQSTPGSIDSIWAVQLTVQPGLPQNGGPAISNISLSVGGAPVRDPLVVWVTPAGQ